MRRLSLIILGIMALFSTSCTQNNGHIGFWFGTWQCSEISVDGERQSGYTGNMFFKFQTNVCDIVIVSTHNDFTQYFCEFKRQDNGTIILDCGHTSGTDSFHDYDFDMPSGLPFIKGENILRYDKINSRKVKLTYDNDGKTYIFTLKKQ